MAAQGRAAAGHQADARPHHTSRSTHLHQWGADDNQIDQDELFDCHVNSRAVVDGRTPRPLRVPVSRINVPVRDSHRNSVCIRD
ncbi:hypothetical protein MRB56_12415 [Halomonas cupida]|uniref:hypothetical protein n=1 Tax=Halomonas cupida TaxID=44933 RepID=UPI00116118AF|nr:hypothetical protein [Halomonas cupida]